jgi:hypothetical protein
VGSGQSGRVLQTHKVLRRGTLTTVLMKTAVLWDDSM